MVRCFVNVFKMQFSQMLVSFNIKRKIWQDRHFVHVTLLYKWMRRDTNVNRSQETVHRGRCWADVQGTYTDGSTRASRSARSWSGAWAFRWRSCGLKIKKVSWHVFICKPSLVLTPSLLYPCSCCSVQYYVAMVLHICTILSRRYSHVTMGHNSFYQMAQPELNTARHAAPNLVALVQTLINYSYIEGIVMNVLYEKWLFLLFFTHLIIQPGEQKVMQKNWVQLISSHGLLTIGNHQSLRVLTFSSCEG